MMTLFQIALNCILVPNYKKINEKNVFYFEDIYMCVWGQGKNKKAMCGNRGYEEQGKNPAEYSKLY